MKFSQSIDRSGRSKKHLIWIASAVAAVLALPLLPIPGLSDVGQAEAAECSNVGVDGLSVIFTTDGCYYKVIDKSRGWEEHCVSWAGDCDPLIPGNEYQVDIWTSSWDIVNKQHVEGDETANSQPAIPSGVQVQATYGQASLQWDGAAGAGGYNVYRNDNYIATVFATSYVESVPPGNYAYYVTSFDPSKQFFSSRSLEVSADTSVRVTTDAAKAIIEAEEGFQYSGSDAQLLLENRARFNQAEDPNLFNQFNPVRASLSGQELANYDSAVQRIRTDLEEKGRERTSPDQRMDPSMSYLLATTLVEGFWPNTGAAEYAVTAVDGNWNINAEVRGAAICPQIGSANGQLERGFVEIDVGDVVVASIDRRVRPENISDLTAIHEAAHTYACSRALFGSNSANDTGDLVAIHSEMSQQFDADGNVGGLTAYAYYDQHEFWAETVSLMTTPTQRNEIRQQSPDLYTWIKTHFAWNHLPDA